MISLKMFVQAIQDAVVNAGEGLRDNNVALLDKYFEEKEDKTLAPKMVVLELHRLAPDNEVVKRRVQVPLITLVPLTVTRIEKATLSADFEMEVVNNELQVNFAGRSASTSIFRNPFAKAESKNLGRLEITMTPQEAPEGLRLMVEAYEATLKQQIS